MFSHIRNLLVFPISVAFDLPKLKHRPDFIAKGAVTASILILNTFASHTLGKSELSHFFPQNPLYVPLLLKTQYVLPVAS